MALITGSELLAKCLKKEGVEDLFFIMGGPMLLAEASGARPGQPSAGARSLSGSVAICPT